MTETFIASNGFTLTRTPAGQLEIPNSELEHKSTYYWGSVRLGPRSQAALREYFAAHPDPKPSWVTDVHEGDVWVLTVDNRDGAWIADGDLDFTNEDGEWIYQNNPASIARVTAGRRIYRKGENA